MGSNLETARQSLIPDVPEEHLGPAMSALSPPQRRFVVALLETGAQDNTKAAVMAGYGGTQNAQWQSGHRLAHNPRVLAAVKEEAERRLRAGAILAASALIEICADPHHKDRFKAAQELKNYAGLVNVSEHKLIIEDTRSNEEVVEAIKLLAVRNGLDPAKLLGQNTASTVPAPVIEEGTYTEVQDEDDLSDLMGEP